MFTRAVVRPPAKNFALGLTTVDLGMPDYHRALAVHAQYCQALEECGLALTCLPADERYPDSTFVEDTAILTPHAAIFTRPGAESRAGEVEAIAVALSTFYDCWSPSRPPARWTAVTSVRQRQRSRRGHFLIGISARTNEEGAAQLSHLLARQGYTM